jgi:hypothetical protein
MVKSAQEPAGSSFQDLHPHAGSLPNRRIDRLTTDEEPPESNRAVYRSIFRGMPVAGLPDLVEIGSVSLFQTAGPVMSQVTEARQRPGLALGFDKVMRTAVPIGQGRWLTVGQMDVDPDADVSQELPRWRDVVAEAVGLLAVVLDERVAQELLHEDVVFLRGDEPVHSADMLQGLRHFLPYEVRALELKALEQIAASSTAIAPELRTAARWYLKGAQAGPVADAVIYFWVALEALTPGEQQGVKSLETMLVEAGWNMEDGDPELGKMAGLRADIVHHAVEDPARIREGYYRLEAAVRVLLRRGLNVMSTWPAAASTPTFITHSDEIEASRVAWTVEWHDDMPVPEPAVTTPDLEWAVIQAPPLTAGFEIAVDADVAPHWIRKIELYTATAAMVLEDSFDGADLHVVVEDFPAGAPGIARVNAARISLATSYFRRQDPKREARLADSLFGAVPQQQLMRRGVSTDVPLGAYLLDLTGAFCSYHAFVATGFVAAEHVRFPEQIVPADLKTAAELCGAALAKSEMAGERLNVWMNDASTEPRWAQLTARILDEWNPHSPGELLTTVAAFWAALGDQSADR